MRAVDLPPGRNGSRKAWLITILSLGTLCLVVGASVTYTVLFPPFWTENIPVMNATHQELALTEYRSSGNVSFSELCAFLDNDTTERTDYRYPNYTCGDFALRLHDAAELEGIECGIVAVTLNTTGYMPDSIANDSENANDNNDRGHAFVVFDTTDRGPVYVDATGVTRAEKIQGIRPCKMSVYFLEGMPLGEIALNQSERFDYGYYQQRERQYSGYIDNITRLMDGLEAYNDEARALNGTTNATMEARRQALLDEKHALQQRDEAKWIITKPFGIVTTANAYW